MKRTATLLKVRSRCAVLGWDGGAISVVLFPATIGNRELQTILSSYAEPLIVKYGTTVQIPIRPEPEPVTDYPMSMVEIALETIELQRYAAVVGDDDWITVWCGYGPLSDRWVVRQA